MTVTNEYILLALRDVATGLNTKIDSLASVQAEHTKQLGQLQTDVTEVKRIVGTNYISFNGKIELVADMLMNHAAAYHTAADRRPA